MELLLVRHAVAEDRRDGLPDADRRLTPKGKKRFDRHVEALRRLELAPTAILHSPWTRAVQTAAMLAPLCKSPPRVEEGLARDPDERLLARVGNACGPDGRVALVGHEPWMSELLSWLVCNRPHGGDERFALKKGAVAWLSGSLHPGAMTLRALLPPKVLRLAGD